MRYILFLILNLIPLFVNSGGIVVKQEPSKYDIEFIYNSTQDIIYSVSFPIELSVQNTTDNSVRIISMGYYYLLGYNGIEKKWWNNLTIYEKKEDSLVWIGEEVDILYLEPSLGKKYVTYTEHFINNDSTFQKHFKSVIEKMKKEKVEKLKISLKQFTEKQICYLKNMIVKDSIRVDAFLDAHRHRSKFIIDAQKVFNTEP